ncbi:hypothetical protein M0Q50_05835 [bacterium]|jgi:hypothetical protein|nr:hypothetical protein [bacterium]
MKVLIKACFDSGYTKNKTLIRMKKILDISLSEVVALYDMLSTQHICDKNFWLELDIVEKLQNIGWVIKFETEADIEYVISQEKKNEENQKKYNEAKQWYDNLPNCQHSYVDILLNNNICTCHD